MSDLDAPGGQLLDSSTMQKAQWHGQIVRGASGTKASFQRETNGRWSTWRSMVGCRCALNVQTHLHLSPHGPRDGGQDCLIRYINHKDSDPSKRCYARRAVQAWRSRESARRWCLESPAQTAVQRPLGLQTWRTGQSIDTFADCTVRRVLVRVDKEDKRRLEDRRQRGLESALALVVSQPLLLPDSEIPHLMMSWAAAA